MADLKRVRVWAAALIALHLDDSWTFAFDNAKTRAGLCNYTHKRITVSRYLAERFDDDDIHQVLLHEVAHALAGPRAGHGPRWKAVASDLGYVGKRTHDGSVADEFAPWVGVCPAGHEVYRYRKPDSRPRSCSKCSRSFSSAHVIVWTQRELPRRAASRMPRG